MYKRKNSPARTYGGRHNKKQRVSNEIEVKFTPPQREKEIVRVRIENNNVNNHFDDEEEDVTIEQEHDASVEEDAFATSIDLLNNVLSETANELTILKNIYAQSKNRLNQMLSEKEATLKQEGSTLINLYETAHNGRMIKKKYLVPNIKFDQGRRKDLLAVSVTTEHIIQTGKQPKETPEATRVRKFIEENVKGLQQFAFGNVGIVTDVYDIYLSKK